MTKTQAENDIAEMTKSLTDIAKEQGAYISAFGECNITLTEAQLKDFVNAVNAQNSDPASLCDSQLRMIQAYPKLSEFFEKYAIGSKVKSSCFKCGSNKNKPAIEHLELPDIYICDKCAAPQTLPPEWAEYVNRLEKALTDINAFVTGDKFPNWSVEKQYASRCYVADICHFAIASKPKG